MTINQSRGSSSGCHAPDYGVTWFVAIVDLTCSPPSQMYIHHGIHEFIFNYVGSLEASQVLIFTFPLCPVLNF